MTSGHPDRTQSRRSPPPELPVGCNDETLKLRDLFLGCKLMTIERHKDFVHVVSVTPDGH
jgi:hypothetical protein